MRVEGMAVKSQSVDDGGDSGAATKRRNWRGNVELTATLVTLLAAVGVLIVLFVNPVTRPAAAPARRQVKLPVEPMSLRGASVTGDAAAKVGLAVFSDFQCPYGGRFGRDVIPQLRAEYVTPGRVFFAFRNFPLRSHPMARAAAEAATCAGGQGHFWDAHDAFFLGQSHLDDLTSHLAERLGLDAKAFSSCVAGEGRNQVDADLTMGKELGVLGTPTSYIGLLQGNGLLKATAVIDGARGVADFKAALDDALKKADAGSR
jgi:protein-disulfide isomerase